MACFDLTHALVASTRHRSRSNNSGMEYYIRKINARGNSYTSGHYYCSGVCCASQARNTPGVGGFVAPPREDPLKVPGAPPELKILLYMREYICPKTKTRCNSDCLPNLEAWVVLKKRVV